MHRVMLTPISKVWSGTKSLKSPVSSLGPRNLTLRPGSHQPAALEPESTVPPNRNMHSIYPHFPLLIPVYLSQFLQCLISLYWSGKLSIFWTGKLFGQVESNHFKLSYKHPSHNVHDIFLVMTEEAISDLGQKSLESWPLKYTTTPWFNKPYSKIEIPYFLQHVK